MGGGGGGGIGFGGGGGGMGNIGDGGGGAGYGAGGGGGGDNGAGAGGGGSSFATATATNLSSALSDLLDDGQVTITPAAPGEGCPSTLQVAKVVSGTATTSFTEHVNCTAPTITAAATTTTEDVDLPFNPDGSPDASNPPAGWSVVNGTWQNQDASLVNSTCTVIETVTGGADSVTYSCAWTPGVSDHIAGVGCPGDSSGPSSTSASVTFEGSGDSALLTVTNTFPPATPNAEAVVVQPHFAG
jgi:hypothetical protein